MDLFGDDIDSFYQNDNDALNDNIREENVIEEAEEDNGEKDEDGDGEGKLDENGEPIKVEPKKRSVRRPQVSKSLNHNLQIQYKKSEPNSLHYMVSVTFKCGTFKI